ncbi:MAG: hypothetical protein ABW164_09700 [Sphingobium sp.]
MIEGWSPGIGDPTPLGWLTVAAYVMACAAALRAAQRDVPGNAGIWLCIAIFLCLLALNKQLDLQTLLTVLARKQAVAGGWYDNRRVFQQGFILCLLFVSAMLIVRLLHLTQTGGCALRTAIVGVSLLLLFICVRAVSFHNMDAFMGSTFLGVTANHILEIAGIAIAGIAALSVRPWPRSRAVAGEDFPPRREAMGAQAQGLNHALPCAVDRRSG